MSDCSKRSAKPRRWMGLFLFATLIAGVAQLQAESGDPSARVARLAYIEGTVSLQPSGVDQWSQAETNYPVATGDRIYTDQNGRDELSIGGVVVRMWHVTDLTMTNLNDQLTQLGLAQGTVRLRTFGLDPNQQVEVDTPNGAITVTQPGDIRIDSFEGDGGTQLTVNSGAVQVTGPNLSQNVGAGTSLRLVGTNPIQLEQLAMPGLDEFDQFSVARDRHIENSPSAQYVSRTTPGFDDLDDYGSWDAGTEYGPVWYPRQVAPDWVPYRTGHWVWTGPWGWTWVESEPWGYAPFHYGRWAYIGSRWGWVPGPVVVRPYWSPALVVFAGGGGLSVGFGGGGLTAWFPLGVGEPFIPWYHCSPGYIRQINVTNINITRIHNTTIINNYNNFVRNTNNYTNINNGSYQYAHRQQGFTAVPVRAVASGQPINRSLAQVRPEQIRSAQVIAHPSIQPTRQSIVPRPVAHAVPVPAQRPTLLTSGGRQAQAVAGSRSQAVPYHPLPTNTARGVQPGARPLQQGPVAQAPGQQNVRAPQAVGARPGPGGMQTPHANPPANTNERPLITRNGTSMPARTGAPMQPGALAGNQARPQNQSGSYNRPTVTTNGNRGSYPAQPLVIHNEPPAQQPSFQQQQRGMQHDPGRPLDPQQRETVQGGRVPGPSHDQEYFPHAGQSQPAPQQQQMRAPQQQPMRAPQQQEMRAPQPQPMRAPQQQQMRAPQPQQRSMPEPRSAPQAAPHSAPQAHGGGDHQSH
jgi:hypothetical protein